MLYEDMRSMANQVVLTGVQDYLDHDYCFIFEITDRQLKFLMDKNPSDTIVSFEDLQEELPGHKTKLWWGVNSSRQLCVEKMRQDLYYIGSRFLND